MRSTLAYLLLLLMTSSAGLVAAQGIERKIIVEDGQFTYFIVDPETQLAHLYSGNVRQTMKQSKENERIIPTGRSFDEAANPLSFSKKGNELISINWIQNPLNSRYDAIRKTDLLNWQKQRPDWKNEEWAEASFAQPVLAPNMPWERMLADNNTLFNCFFDLTTDGSDLVMAVCNQGRIRVSRYSGNRWAIGKTLIYPEPTSFSLLARSGKIALLTAEGTLYRYDAKRTQLRLLKKGMKKNQLLVEDHDRQKYFLLDPQVLEAQTAGTFESIVNESGIELTF